MNDHPIAPPDRATARRAETVLLGLTLVWGVTFVIVKDALAEISPVEFIAIRFVLSAAILYALFPLRSIRMDRWLVRNGFVLGVASYAGFVLQTTGLNYTTASNSGFITGMAVVFTPLIQIAIERRYPRWNHVAGIAAAVTGLCVLAGAGAGGWNAGDLLTLGCAVAFSFYIVWLDIVSPRHDFVPLTMMQILTVMALALLSAPVVEQPRAVFSAASLEALVFTALLATVLTTLLQIKYQPRTTPTKAVVIFTAEPVFAALCGHYFLHESFTAAGWIGAGLILGGVLVSELAGKPREA